MYDEDPDECIFVTERIRNGTSSALSLGQLNGDPNEGVHIVYENVKRYPEVLIVREVSFNRISGMEANHVAESTVSEPIASISTLPVNEKDENETKTSRARGTTRTTFVCGICWETSQEVAASDRKLMSTVCGHVYCSLCITKALKESKFCPICRKLINPQKVHPIYV